MWLTAPGVEVMDSHRWLLPAQVMYGSLARWHFPKRPSVGNANPQQCRFSMLDLRHSRRKLKQSRAELIIYCHGVLQVKIRLPHFFGLHSFLSITDGPLTAKSADVRLRI